ncbi:MAG TPA: hypothetical protein VN026_11495 [Bacteroidia bacterium]|jgi:hypothetical protein|nr:hypothetical protein [Bacteroidia bacterium]
METNKDKFKKLSVEQRMFMLMHEFIAHNMPPRPYIDHEAEQKKYFENFPFDEQAVRDFLKCRKELGYYENIDIQTVKLSDILSYPDYNYGFRILNVTVGKGTHKGGYVIPENYEVNEDEVYVTYNNMYNLAGGVYTVIMQRKDGVNKLIKSYCHARS